MRSYLILTPPGGPDPDHRSTLVIADGFSWAGFLMSWIWLFWHRLWVAGLVAFVVQVGGGLLLQMPGFGVAGLLVGLALSLLVGLEGRHYLSGVLMRRGWTLDATIFAPDRQTAEMVYFSNLPQPDPTSMPSSADWANRSTVSGHDWQSADLGLFDHGGR